MEQEPPPAHDFSRYDWPDSRGPRLPSSKRPITCWRRRSRQFQIVLKFYKSAPTSGHCGKIPRADKPTPLPGFDKQAFMAGTAGEVADCARWSLFRTSASKRVDLRFGLTPTYRNG